MAHNIDTMAYYGDKPWHELGVAIPERATAEEMIKAAGLDWKVETHPARGATKLPAGHYSRYEILRMPRDDSSHEVLLGIVGRYYVPLQNIDAFKFFDPVIGDSKAAFETAGALGQGECIWALAKMPESMEIVSGDECHRYLLLSNRHDGQGSVTIKFTSVRVVCQNTLMLAMKDGMNAYRVMHSSVMHERLDEIGEILGMARKMYDECSEVFKAMARKTLARNNLDVFLEAVYPRTELQKKKSQRPEKWERIDRLLEERSDLLLPGVSGTLWAAYNAVTHYEDFRQTKKPEDPSARLARIWFGGSANNKLRALDVARGMVS